MNYKQLLDFINLEQNFYSAVKLTYQIFENSVTFLDMNIYSQHPVTTKPLILFPILTTFLFTTLVPKIISHFPSSSDFAACARMMRISKNS